MQETIAAQAFMRHFLRANHLRNRPSVRFSRFLNRCGNPKTGHSTVTRLAGICVVL